MKSIKIKGIINLVLTLTIAVNLFMPLSAYADEPANKTYEYSGFTVEYNTADSGANSKNVNITITNTGVSPIENWMLSYDFNGDITGIWNASVETDDSGNAYVKNAVHNAIIAPDSSVAYGYALENANGFPDEFAMIQEREIKESGYSVDLKTVNTWGSEYNGEIILTNATDKPIIGWELAFDCNFELTNSWSADIIHSENGKYTLKGTYTNIIYPNSSVSLGFSAVCEEEPVISAHSLSELKS
jgi:hypothetical protein